MRTDAIGFVQPPINKKYVRKDAWIKNILSPFNIFYIMAFFVSTISFEQGMIPFAIPIFCTFIMMGLNKTLVFTSVLLGASFLNNYSDFLVVLISVFLVLIADSKLKGSKKNNPTLLALMAFFSVLTVEIIFAITGLFDLNIIRLVVKLFGVFSCIFIFSIALRPFRNNLKMVKPTEEEMVGFCILLVLFIHAISTITFIGESIASALFFLVVLIIAFTQGAGASTAIAVCIALISTVVGDTLYIHVGVMAICGLLSGTLKSLGKVGSCLGLTLGFLIFSIYQGELFNSFFVEVQLLIQMLIASSVFFAIPSNLLDKISAKTLNKDIVMNENKEHNVKIKQIAKERLDGFSNAFRELSKTFEEGNDVNTNNSELNALFDRVVEKVCKDCCLCNYCWEKNFFYTYQVTFKILEKLEENGRIEQEDISNAFIDKCQRIFDFTQAVNNTYEIFKVNTMWKNKVGENKGAFSRQLENISNMIATMANDLASNIKFKTDIEDKLSSELLTEGIRLKGITVYENKFNNREINIEHMSCGGKKLCVNVIEKSISDFFKKKYVRDSHCCKSNMSSSCCNLRLIKENPFNVITGVAQIAKNNSNVSGDNYTFLKRDDGKFIVALSDGMGSGVLASRHSKATINLLEQFMEADFDRDITLKLINSVLGLKASEDSFATLDLGIIDLFTAQVEFVKIGAVSSFIKRRNNVTQIKHDSLPVGVLSDIDVDIVKHQLRDGDFVIMLSDGILECFNEIDKEFYQEDISSENSFIIDFISNIDSNNPQHMADEILSKCYKHIKKEPEDDMLIMVSKIWERS